MTDHAFQAELELLKKIAAGFAAANPALAPLLGGNRTDPDVERLLEAAVFQTAMLRRRLDLDFPELIHQLANLILPHYLRPIPATTIIGFTPDTALWQSAIIPAGTRLGSSPVNGTTCSFATTAELELHPLELMDASFHPKSSRSGELRLSLTLRALPLSDWRPQAVRLFLAGEHAFAADLYLLLCRHLSRIVLTPAKGGAAVTLPAGCLAPAGFASDHNLLPYPTHAPPGYRILQEYFSAPEKFLFFDLKGWEQWRQRGEGVEFSIGFELDNLPFQPQRVRGENFVLHAVPAVNLFAHAADPIIVDRGAGSCRIRPAGPESAQTRIFSVDRVTGYSRATNREREYLAGGLFHDPADNEPTYHTLPAPVAPHGGQVLSSLISHPPSPSDVDLRISFPQEIGPPEEQTLTVALTCTNGTLPESLCIGDVSRPLCCAPNFISARNITPIIPCQPSPCGPQLLQQLISHLYLNYLPLATPGHLRSLLDLYVFAGQRATPRGAANLLRLSGVEDLETTAAERMVAGVAMKGRETRVKVCRDQFAGPGDLYLFGCVLDHFLGCYASLGSYSQLAFQETSKGGGWQWPPRLGRA